MKLYDFDKTVDYNPKKGVWRILQLIFHHFFDLIAANLLFLLTSLPVFTLGASLAALGRITALISTDKPVSVTADYFHYFKKYFKRGCLCGAVVFIPFLIICFSALFYSELSQSIYAFKFAEIISISAIFVLCLIIPYFFNLITIKNEKPPKSLKRAFFLSIYNWKGTFLSFLFFFVFTAIVFLFFPFTIIAAVLFYFSFCSLIASYCTIQALNMYFQQ